MELNFEKIFRARDYLLERHGIVFYPFQREISNAIIRAVYDPLRLQAEVPGEEIFVEVSRQAGKTTAVAYTVEFLFGFTKPFLGQEITIGIFAPQREQAKTDFDRLKQYFEALKRLGTTVEFDEYNAQTLNIKGKGVAYIFPITETSHPESKFLDLMVFEEAQDINDQKMIRDVFPMGAARNAVRIFIGSGGFRICYFYRGLQREDTKKFIYSYDEVIRQKREAYEPTKNPFHLQYERYIEREKQVLGEDSDEFKAPYRLIWVLGTGQFITSEQFEKLVGNFSRCYQEKKDPVYAGIDTAKDPDSTVVTALRWNSDKRKKQIINWLELKGDNYKDQFDIIMNFLSNYNVKAVAIDSTAQGDFMPDMFERETQWRDERSGLYRVKFSLPMKDILYKNLLNVIRNFLTEVPRIETKEAERFKQQLLDLQKEYKGELLSCHHPDDPNAHDDYSDSWSLAEYAYMKEQERGEPEITIIGGEPFEGE